MDRPTHLRPVDAKPETRSETGLPVVPSVDETLAAAIAGDPEAWGRVYASHYRDVFRQLRYLTGDRSQAEELAQETFAQAMVSRDRYDRQRPFGAWLRGIALNVARKRWRSQQGAARGQQKLQVLQEAASGVDGLLQRELDRERSEALYAALEELPESWREAFVLKELQEMSAAEAGRILGTTEGNISVRVTRARRRIREIFVRRGLLGSDRTGGEESKR